MHVIYIFIKTFKVVRIIIMMFYYLNAYNANINAQLAF